MKLVLKRFLISITVLATASPAFARIFSFDKQSTAGYLLVTDGMSAINKASYQTETSPFVIPDNKFAYNYSGEFGVVISRPFASFKAGVEIINPQSQNIIAVNNGTTDIYSEKSTMTVFTPKASVDISLRANADSRSYFTYGLGLANITTKSDFSNVTVGGVGDHSVEGKGNAFEQFAAIGHEAVLSDTTTYTFEAGYRLLKFTNLKYSKDVTTISGAKTAGSPMLMSDGSQRELDFSGAYISLGLRFYF